MHVISSCSHSEYKKSDSDFRFFKNVKDPLNNSAKVGVLKPCFRVHVAWERLTFSSIKRFKLTF